MAGCSVSLVELRDGAVMATLKERQASGEGRLVATGCVRAVMLGVVQPAVEVAASFGFGGVAAGVGPAVGQGRGGSRSILPLVCGW